MNLFYILFRHLSPIKNLSNSNAILKIASIINFIFLILKTSSLIHLFQKTSEMSQDISHFPISKPPLQPLTHKYLIKDNIEVKNPYPSILIPDQTSLSPNKKYFKKSTMYSLSRILHRWCKKEFVLNLFNNTLLIRKKGKENLLYLSRCSVQNLGKFKKKWCFSLLNSSVDEKNNKIKKYVIGCDQKDAFDEWIFLLTEELHVTSINFLYFLKFFLRKKIALKSKTFLRKFFSKKDPLQIQSIMMI